MTTLTLSKAREKIGDAVNAVEFGGDRVLLQRHGKSVAAIVSVEDYELLERLEDQILGEIALKRLTDPNEKSIPFKGPSKKRRR